MNVLQKNNIPISWPVLYVGYKKQFIDAEEILELIYSDLLSPIEEDLIVKLEMNQESRELFLSILEMIALSDCKEQDFNFESEINRADRLWQLGYLKEIALSQGGIDYKLNQIENLWARFNYPKEWEQFIYYLPNDKLVSKSKETIYNLFLSFLNENELN